MNSSVVLAGFQQLTPVRWLLVPLFFCVWIFTLLSDSLIVFVIITRRILHKPMFIFIAAVLANSFSASCTIFPKLLWDLGSGPISGPVSGPVSGPGVVQVPLSSCLAQAFWLHFIGSSSFMLLGAMSLDRLLSITRPLHYTVLMSGRRVVCLLLFCWLCPLLLIGFMMALLIQLPLCRDVVQRLYCDPYTVTSLSCAGGAAQLAVLYGSVVMVLVLFVPAIFVVFSYAHILWVCVFRSFSRRALHTCVPHIAVFLNYVLSCAFDLLHRRISSTQGQSVQVVATAASLIMVVIPTVFNPLVYGLKVSEIHRQLSTLLQRMR